VASARPYANKSFAACSKQITMTAPHHSILTGWMLFLIPKAAQPAVSHSTQKGPFGDVPQAKLLAWYGKTKPNTTKASIHQSTEIYCNTKQTQKTKARYSYLLRHPAWKWRGPILILALHKYVTYLLKHLPTYLQPQDPHGAKWLLKLCVLLRKTYQHSKQSWWCVQ